ncbi:MAG: ABC transporter permease, partial [Synergistaceae bacterium]|nr:ABC transporter permease [Synergistaceae bacterium]
MRIIPGDPARMALGPTAPEEVVERYRERMHYNEPLAIQYWYWLSDVFHGDLGMSSVTHRPVTQDLREFLPATMELAIWAGIPPVFFALLLGVLGAMYKNRWPDYLIRFSSYIIIATPTFVWAVLFLLVFGYWLPVLPSIGGRLSMGFEVPAVTGLMVLDALISGQPAAAWDAMAHLSLPALALSLGHTMQEARLTRSYMLENDDKDYITMITSQGVPRNVISRKYLLRPSVIPTVSIMGLDIAAIFGNAFLVETIFNWPGMSRYAMNAILGKDISAVCGVVLVLGVIFITTNLTVDMVVMILDPRMRSSRSR